MRNGQFSELLEDGTVTVYLVTYDDYEEIISKEEISKGEKCLEIDELL
jgi:hypothetical protein